MVKKLLILALCVAYVLLSVGSADTLNEDLRRYQYARSVTAGLNIAGSTAECYGNIVPIDNMKTSIVVRLQKKEGETWKTIRTWTGSNSAGQSEAGGTKSIVTGYEYRVYVTGKVYDSGDNVVEAIDKYSSVVST